MLAHLCRGLLERVTGGIHQNVNMTELLYCRVTQRIERLSIPHIRGLAIRPASRGLDVAAYLRYQVLTAACGNHIGSMFCKTGSDHSSDTGSCTNHHGDAI